jgi:hypothetical protein
MITIFRATVRDSRGGDKKAEAYRTTQHSAMSWAEKNAPVELYWNSCEQGFRADFTHQDRDWSILVAQVVVED